MGVIPSAEVFLYTAFGFLLYWGYNLLLDRAKTSKENRRREVDELSAVRTENRKLKESLHTHRVLMIDAGLELPPFLPSKED